MTRIQRIEISCPHCQQKQAAEIYQTLNITINSDKKQELFAGKINVLSCTKCKQQVTISTPFLYHDMERKIAVYYYPPNVINNSDFLKQFKPDGTMNTDLMRQTTGRIPQEAVDSAYLTEYPHIVFDMQELLTYVVFRDKLFEMNKP
jgi:hypothetical protein